MKKPKKNSKTSTNEKPPTNAQPSPPGDRHLDGDFDQDHQG